MFFPIMQHPSILIVLKNYERFKTFLAIFFALSICINYKKNSNIGYALLTRFSNEGLNKMCLTIQCSSQLQLCEW